MNPNPLAISFPRRASKSITTYGLLAILGLFCFCFTCLSHFISHIDIFTDSFFETWKGKGLWKAAYVRLFMIPDALVNHVLI